jgi:excisionase family DNA binding protein
MIAMDTSSKNSQANQISFDQLPQAVSQMNTKLDQILKLVLNPPPPIQVDQDRWYDLNELVAYDPEKRSKITFYGYIRRRDIPFHKSGKKIIFLKSEIDAWLKQGRQKTHEEISTEAEKYLTDTGKIKAQPAL